MSRFRKAGSFRDKGVPGDPRLLAAIARRTPNLSDGSVTHVFGSTIITPKKQRNVTRRTHPFQLVNTTNDVDGTQVFIRPGMISSPYGWSNPPTGMDIITGQTVAITETCYVFLKFEITSTETPTIDDITIETDATVPTDTGTIAYLVIGYVERDTGPPATITSIFQNVETNLLHDLAFEGYSYPDFWRQLVGPVSSAL